MVRTLDAMQSIPYKGQINSGPHNTNYGALYNSLIAGMDFPIGGIVAVFTNMTGCPAPSASLGWAQCNGTTALSQGVSSPVITGVLPNINAGAFIRGATTSWSSGGSSGGADTHTHGVGSYAGPSHTHTGPSHTHDVSGTTGSGSSHSHGVGSYKFKIASITGNASPNMYWAMYTSAGASDYIAFRVTGGTGAVGIWAIDDPGEERDYYTTSGSGTSSTESSHTHSFSDTSTAGGTGATGAAGTGAITGISGSASTLPVYFNAKYYMRCK